jgi:hypothetical protein
MKKKFHGTNFGSNGSDVDVVILKHTVMTLASGLQVNALPVGLESLFWKTEEEEENKLCITL